MFEIHLDNIVEIYSTAIGYISARTPGILDLGTTRLGRAIGSGIIDYVSTLIDSRTDFSYVLTNIRLYDKNFRLLDNAKISALFEHKFDVCIHSKRFATISNYREYHDIEISKDDYGGVIRLSSHSMSTDALLLDEYPDLEDHSSVLVVLVNSLAGYPKATVRHTPSIDISSTLH